MERSVCRARFESVLAATGRCTVPCKRVVLEQGGSIMVPADGI
jgi:hypothetical protein